MNEVVSQKCNIETLAYLFTMQIFLLFSKDFFLLQLICFLIKTCIQKNKISVINFYFQVEIKFQETCLV